MLTSCPLGLARVCLRLIGSSESNLWQEMNQATHLEFKIALKNFLLECILSLSSSVLSLLKIQLEYLKCELLLLKQ